jgi:hypothetical protein
MAFESEVEVWGVSTPDLNRMIFEILPRAVDDSHVFWYDAWAELKSVNLSH